MVPGTRRAAATRAARDKCGVQIPPSRFRRKVPAASAAEDPGDENITTDGAPEETGSGSARGTARTSPGSGPTPRPRCRSTRKASGRASATGFRRLHRGVAGPVQSQSLRSSLSTGSGGSGLSTGTGSDVSLDSQGRPRHRVGPRARHVPGDATPDYRVHGGKFAMAGDRTPDYRHALNDSTLEPRYRHVLPVGDHAVQEYMRARLRHHPSSELTDTEGSSAVDDEFGGGKARTTPVGSASGPWTGLPRWFDPISPHRDRDARYRHRTCLYPASTCTAGAGRPPMAIRAAAAAERGPGLASRTRCSARFWRRRAAGRGRRTGKTRSSRVSSRRRGSWPSTGAPTNR